MVTRYKATTVIQKIMTAWTQIVIVEMLKRSKIRGILLTKPSESALCGFTQLKQNTEEGKSKMRLEWEIETRLLRT